MTLLYRLKVPVNLRLEQLSHQMLRTPSMSGNKDSEHYKEVSAEMGECIFCLVSYSLTLMTIYKILYN